MQDKKYIIFGIIFIFLLANSTLVLSIPILEQSGLNTNLTTYGGGIFTHTAGSRMGFGGIFLANKSFNLSIVTVDLQRVNNFSGNLEMAIYSASSKTAITSFIANGSMIDASNITTLGGRTNFTFSSPISISNGSYYFVGFKWLGSATSFPTGLYFNRANPATGYASYYYDGTGDVNTDWVGSTPDTQPYFDFWSNDSIIISVNNITLLSHVPDITDTSLFTIPYTNFTYNVSTINLTNSWLSYTVIDPISSAIVITNGTLTIENNTNFNKSLYNVTSGNYSIFVANLTENELYPIRQNYFYMNVSSYVNVTLGINDLYKDEILNLSNNTLINIYELPLLTSIGGIAKVYAYNTTYVSGDPASLIGTTELCTFTSTTTSNHTHGPIGHNLCYYQAIPNQQGFIITRLAGTVTLQTSTNSFRLNSGMISNNNGITYSNSNTLLSHVHQFAPNTKITYMGFANYSGTIFNTTLYTDTYNIDPTNPLPATITNPLGQTNFTQYINITYTGGVNVSGTPIGYYLIRLLDENLTPIGIIRNNSLNLSYYWNTYDFNLSTNTTYYIKVETYDNLSLSSFDIESFKTTTNGNILLNVYNNTGGQITNYNITLTDINTSISQQFNSTSANYNLSIIKGHAYNISIYGGLIANASTIITPNITYNYLNITTYPFNSIRFTILEENTLTPLNLNVSLSFYGTMNSFNTFINGSSKTIANILQDEYVLTVSTPGYSPRQYIISVAEGSSQEVTLLFSNATAILFNFKTTTGASIDGVNLYVYIYNGTTTYLSTSTQSDITGKAQVYLRDNTAYLLSTYKEGYNNYSFTLNPVLFTSYDVILRKDSGSLVIPSATVSFTPTGFYRFQNVNFNIEFISPYNSLSSYYYYVKVSSSNTSYTDSGSNSHGEKFTQYFTLNNVSNGDTLNIYYYYNLSNGGSYSKNLTYPIVYVYSNRTWTTMGNSINQTTGQDTITGYFVGERVLIVTFITVVMFGVGWLIGGGITGFIFAIIPILFFINSGFVPKQLYYVTFIFFIFYIIGRGSDS